VPGPRPPRWGSPRATLTVWIWGYGGYRVAGRSHDHRRASRGNSVQARAGPAGPSQESAAQSRVKLGRTTARAGTVVRHVRVDSVGAAPQEPGPRPCQSGRRWSTDGPAASTSRRTRTRRQGPGVPDYAFRGAADRPPRTGRARRREATRRKGSVTCLVVFQAG
jgi:hypothetical protein